MHLFVLLYSPCHKSLICEFLRIIVDAKQYTMICLICFADQLILIAVQGCTAQNVGVKRDVQRCKST